MTRICRHCKEFYQARCGRGLCSACWRDKAVRVLYPPLAPFGGGAASAFNKLRKLGSGATSAHINREVQS